MSFVKCVSKLIIVLVLTYASTPTHAKLYFHEPLHFAGVAVGGSHLNLKKKYGGNIFRKDIPFINLFAGVNFNEYVGLEFGYQRDNARRANKTLVTGQRIPGSILVPAILSPVVIRTNLKLRSEYLGLTANYPLFDNVSFISLVGAARVNIKASHTILSIAGCPAGDEAKHDMLYVRTYQKSKVVPMVRLGIQHQINKTIAIRSSATWLEVSRIKIISNQNGQYRSCTNTYAPNNRIRLKNATSYLVGVVIVL